MTDRNATTAHQGAGKVVNLREKLGLVADHWVPRVVAQMNDYQFKIVKIKGEFVWHSHADTDETFFVVDGELSIDLRDQGTVRLRAGDLYVVPRGVEHKPHAEHEVSVMLIEPSGVRNTGDEENERTQPNDVWI
ncbi:MAG: cupin domain-containing protein [Trinickia sp.]|jgi:mannose-6-phosphate isomerase-like protein (cupin superfamily)